MMIFISALTEDVPTAAINISGIVAGNYWPMVQTLSLLTSMVLINKNFLQYLIYYHSKTLVITTGWNLLFIGPFIITDELLRVTAVFGFMQKADLIPVRALIAANLALSGFFGYMFSRHCLHQLVYFLVYTITMPLSGVLGLYALLLHEPNGNMFFVEYFTRLCLNVALFSISCWGHAVERPQEILFTIIVWVNVISFIGIVATLSKGIFIKQTLSWDILSMQDIDPKNGILFLPGTKNGPESWSEGLDSIYDGECSSMPTDDLEEDEEETSDSVIIVSFTEVDGERHLSLSKSVTCSSISTKAKLADASPQPRMESNVVASPCIELHLL